jgi:acyl dehydratase
MQDSALKLMSFPKDKIGKAYAPAPYAVGREKVREYAEAVGETNPLYTDVEAARSAGHADVLAPPMFVVVYAGRAMWPVLSDPELEIDFAMLVHGAQEFEWGELVVAGDEITTTVSVKDMTVKAGLRFDTFESVSVNQRDELVSRGLWTNIIRGQE